jgi:hypothetical protein
MEGAEKTGCGPKAGHLKKTAIESSDQHNEERKKQYVKYE